MNKKVLLTLAAAAAFMLHGAAYAENSADITVKTQAAADKASELHQNAGFEKFSERGAKKYRPSKEEMEKKRAEIDKRLNLTEEQKKQIEKNRKQGHEKIKPVMEQKKIHMQELRRIYNDNSLSIEQKREKAAPHHAELKKLKEQMNTYRKENMKSFEALLNDEQKKEFSKIKEEQKKAVEKHKAEFEKKRGKMRNGGIRPKDFPPQFD